MTGVIASRVRVPVADGIHYAGNDVGVLLVHGLGGTPTELKPLAWRIAAAGYTVRLCHLPGHGATESELLSTDRHAWLDAVRRACDSVAQQCSQLVVGGLSMGAVLALGVAAERNHAVSGIIALAPTFRYDGWSVPRSRVLLRWCEPLMATPLGRWYRFTERDPYGVKDERVRARLRDALASGRVADAGLVGTPARSLVELSRLARSVRRGLRHVHAPTLLVHARNDDVSALGNAFDVQRALAGRVEALILDDSYHLVTLDRQREMVADRAVAFVEHVSGMPAAHHASRRHGDD